MVKEGQKQKSIYDVAVEVIRESSGGIRYSQLHRQISERLPDANQNTIHGVLHKLRQNIMSGREGKISIPEKGLFVWNERSSEGRIQGTRKVKEEDFYESFAVFLMEELGDCTKAVSFGGNIFQDRWGTPDVIGVYKFSDLDPIKPPPELITAKAKTATDSSSLITAFGQACSYKLFSHKVYIAIPKQSGQEAKNRLESLCMLFGIGLILFNAESSENPEFEIRTRAQKSEPDYFYLNQYLRRLPEEKKRELFG